MTHTSSSIAAALEGVVLVRFLGRGGVVTIRGIGGQVSQPVSEWNGVM